jgi:hypothetical protein
VIRNVSTGRVVEAGIVYLATALVGNFLWEVGELPLYTLWESATDGELFRAALYCTGGDGLIGASALGVALAAGRFFGWPLFGNAMMAMTILAGVAYTVFSEWVNVEVRHSWAYAANMPVVPVLGTGLAPMLEWLVIPAISFAIACRLCLHGETRGGSRRRDDHSRKRA